MSFFGIWMAQITTIKCYFSLTLVKQVLFDQDLVLVFLLIKRHSITSLIRETAPSLSLQIYRRIFLIKLTKSMLKFRIIYKCFKFWIWSILLLSFTIGYLKAMTLQWTYMRFKMLLQAIGIEIQFDMEKDKFFVWDYYLFTIAQ